MDFDRDRVSGASMWMVALGVALFFVPLLNGLAGGAVGGYRAGSVKGALVAAVLPAVVVAVGVWMVFALFDPPLWWLFDGLRARGAIALSIVGMFIGAAFGGSLASAGTRQAGGRAAA
jgi:hypothetical protein